MSFMLGSAFARTRARAGSSRRMWHECKSGAFGRSAFIADGTGAPSRGCKRPYLDCVVARSGPRCAKQARASLSDVLQSSRPRDKAHLRALSQRYSLALRHRLRSRRSIRRKAAAGARFDQADVRRVIEPPLTLTS